MQQRIMHINSWSTVEQICLASAVRTLGDNNWNSVCDLLRSKFALIERPPNWLTPETCETHYKWLSDKYVKMEISCERPVNQILQSLKLIARKEGQLALEQENIYKELKERLEMFAKNELDSETVMIYYEDSLRRSKEREDDIRKHRDEHEQIKTYVQKLNIFKSPINQDKTEENSPLSTSPLLSSLLNNPPALLYRPTLSTASFIPPKTIQCTALSSLESEQSLPDPNSNLEAQLIIPNDRVSNSRNSVSRKLNFQETTSTIDQSVLAKKSTTRSEDPSLDNISLISANEEYLAEADIPQEILMQVIGNLEEKQLLDKIVNELTGDRDAISKKNLSHINVSLDESIVNPFIEKQSSATVSVDSSQMSGELVGVCNEYEGLKSQFNERNVIVVEDEANINEQIINEYNITGTEQQRLVETITVSRESSYPSTVATHNTPDLLTAVKSDTEPLIEYLDHTAIEKGKRWMRSTNEGVEVDEKPTKFAAVNEESPTDFNNVKVKLREPINVNNESREPVKSYETYDSVPVVQDMEPELPDIKTISLPKDTALLTGLNTNEVAPSDRNETDNIKIETYEPQETDLSSVSDFSLCLETDESQLDVEVDSQTYVKSERNNEMDYEDTRLKRTETAEDEELEIPTVTASPDKFMKPSSLIVSESTVEGEIKQATATNIPVMPLPMAFQKTHEHHASIGKPVEEKIEDIVKDVDEQCSTKQSTGNKSVRKYPRRRRSSVSELSDIESGSSTTEQVENHEIEIVQLETLPKIGITLKDFQTDGLDPDIAEELLQPEEEPLPDIAVEVMPDKGEKREPNLEFKSSKHKKSIRRCSIKVHSQGTPTQKIEEPPTAPAKTPENSQQTTRRKTLLLAHQRLNIHKYSNTFQKPITNRTVTGYEDIIYNPTDLQTIRRKLDSKLITTVAEFQRDVLLMIMNAKMFNRINSQVFNMAVEVQKEALSNMQLTVQTLGEGVLFEDEEVGEKVRKRQSVDTVRRDLKMGKRAKLLTKDESTHA